jgi:hypothetical protein
VHLASSFVDYTAASNWPPTTGGTEGAIRFVIRTDSIHNGSIVQLIFNAAQEIDGSLADKMTLGLFTNNQLYIEWWNSAGVKIMDGGDSFLGNDPISLVLGSTYEVELNWRLGPTASVWIYNNGVIGVSAFSGSLTNSTTASVIRIGGDIENADGGLIGNLKRFKIFDSVQHTAETYTPEF